MEFSLASYRPYLIHEFPLLFILTIQIFIENVMACNVLVFVDYCISDCCFGNASSRDTAYAVVTYCRESGRRTEGHVNCVLKGSLVR
jgi:hypothetical protein